MRRFLLGAVAALVMATGALAGPAFQPGDVVGFAGEKGKALGGPDFPGFRVVHVEGDWLMVEDMSKRGEFDVMFGPKAALIRRAEPMPARAAAPPPAGERAPIRKGDVVVLGADDSAGVVIGFAAGKVLVRKADGSEAAVAADGLTRREGGAEGPPPRELVGGVKLAPKVAPPAAGEPGQAGRFVRLYDQLHNLFYYVPAGDRLELDRIRRRIACGEGPDPSLPWAKKAPGPWTAEGDQPEPHIPPAGIDCPDGKCPNQRGRAQVPYLDYFFGGQLGGK